jgi:hypothetical protein
MRPALLTVAMVGMVTLSAATEGRFIFLMPMSHSSTPPRLETKEVTMEVAVQSMQSNRLFSSPLLCSNQIMSRTTMGTVQWA